MNEEQYKLYQDQLIECFSKININKGDTIYLTGNISKLGRVRLSKNQKIQGLHHALLAKIGKESTIFSPAASMNLCNTDIPFDIKSTPSHEMGPLAEYFRLLPESIRSLHPFWSICGIGKNADCLNSSSKHAYGMGSPWSSMLHLNTRQINFGLHPSKAVTLIHHIETIVGVPYRYTKEFLHPILLKGSLKEELFYLSVQYLESSVQKKILLNEHFFEALESKGLLHESEHPSGMKIWSFLMKDFYNIVIPFFINDIYTYLEQPPKKRPYSL